jgi:hypothetical protein
VYSQCSADTFWHCKVVCLPETKKEYYTYLLNFTLFIPCILIALFLYKTCHVDIITFLPYPTLFIKQFCHPQAVHTPSTKVTKTQHITTPIPNIFNNLVCRFQRPCSLRCGSVAAGLLGLWVRFLPVTCVCVSCECCVLLGRGLCTGLITHTEESYRVCLIVNEDTLVH